MTQEQPAQPDATVLVHVEHLYRRSAYSRQTNGHRAGHSEMLVPELPAWVEQRDDLACFRVDAGEVSSLVGVASFAGQSKIGRIVVSTMFARNDVFHLEPRKRKVFLRKATVLAAIAGPVANGFADGGVHGL